MHIKKKGIHTLNLDPIEENLDDFDESSGRGGKSAATKGHLEAVSRA